MHLFIDTNAFLSFYHHTKDDIDALKMLFRELQAGNIVLHIPRQVRDEWTRNRDAKLLAAAKEFQLIQFKSEIPRHMQGLSMAESYATAIQQAKKARDTLIAEANLKARTHQLDVDKYIKALFDSGECHAHDLDIFSAAKHRAEMGNPPGKPGSYGDQYNWEMLLSRVPDVDLYVVTKDGDYVSVLDGKDDRGMTYPNAFLREEWQTNKPSGNLYVFDSLKSVLAHYNKAIALPAAPAEEQALAEPPAEEAVQRDNVVESPGREAWLPENFRSPAVEAEEAHVEDGLSPEERERKRELIERLIDSASFAETHAAIAPLNDYLSYFTVMDANMLCDGALRNSQIGWIIDDADVNNFFSALVANHFARLDDPTRDGMIELLGLIPDDSAFAEGDPDARPVDDYF